MLYFGIVLMIICQTLVYAVQVQNHLRIRSNTKVNVEKYLNTKLRDVLRSGNTTLEIPVIDPLNQDTFSFESHEKNSSFRIKLKNFSVIGLSDYIVGPSTYSMISKKLIIRLNYPRIYSKGFYSFDEWQSVDLLLHYEGQYELTARNLDLDAILIFSLRDNVSIESIDLHLVLGQLEFHGHGISNNENMSAIISEILSITMPDIVNHYEHEIAKFFTKKIIDKGNHMLKKITPNELIKMIN